MAYLTGMIQVYVRCKQQYGEMLKLLGQMDEVQI